MSRKKIGIQHFKNDPSLSDEEIALIAKWADTGAPRGNVADLPPARVWNDSTRWAIGEPDLVVRTSDILVKGDAPDWWGEIPPTPTGLTEDRYVAALEVREVNDVDSAGTGRETVGGRYVFHHMIWSTRVIDGPEEPINPNEPFSLAALFGVTPGTTTWPVHEVGREADFFDPKSARLLKAGVVGRVRLDPPAFQRPRHQGAPRDRLQVHAQGLQARLPHLERQPRQRRRHRHQGHGRQSAAATPMRC